MMPFASFFGRGIAVGRELREIPVADRVNSLGLALIAFFLLQATSYPVTLFFATVVLLSTTGYMFNSLSISRHVLSQRPIITIAEAEKEKEQPKEPKPAATKLSMGRFLMRADDRTRTTTLSELLPSPEYQKALAEVLHENPQYLPFIIHLCVEHKIDEIIFAACTEKAHFMKILEAFKDDGHKNERILLGMAFSKALISQKINKTPFLEFLQDVKEEQLLKLFPPEKAEYYHPLLIIHLCKRSDSILQKIRPLLGNYPPYSLGEIENSKDLFILAPFVMTKYRSLFVEEVEETLQLQPNESTNFKQKFLNIASGPKTILGAKRVELYENIHACETREALAKVFAFVTDDAISLFFHFAFLKIELREHTKELFKGYTEQLEKGTFDKIFPTEVVIVMDGSFIKDCLPLV
jgi:hypothetical protein